MLSKDGGSAAQSKYGALQLAAADSKRFFASPVYVVAMNCILSQSSCCCLRISKASGRFEMSYGDMNQPNGMPLLTSYKAT